MARPGRYPPEVRERAVRLVLEHRHDYPSQWAAISSIAAKCGMTAETLRKWVRQAEVDSGGRWGAIAYLRTMYSKLCIAFSAPLIIGWNCQAAIMSGLMRT